MANGEQKNGENRKISSDKKKNYIELVEFIEKVNKSVCWIGIIWLHI